MSPEHTLCAAILHRAWADAHSPLPWLHKPARRWWQDAAAVAFFDDLLNLDGRLLVRAQQVVTEAASRAPWVLEQLWLFPALCEDGSLGLPADGKRKRDE